MVSGERRSAGDWAGSAPREELGGSCCPAPHTTHPSVSPLCARTLCRHPLVAWDCSLPLLDASAGTPAWLPMARGVSAHVAPKQLQLLIRRSEQRREQGTRRDGLGQRCRTASSCTDPCLTQPQPSILWKELVWSLPHTSRYGSCPAWASSDPPGQGTSPWAVRVPDERLFLNTVRMAGASQGGIGAWGKCFTTAVEQ